MITIAEKMKRRSRTKAPQNYCRSVEQVVREPGNGAKAKIRMDDACDVLGNPAAAITAFAGKVAKKLEVLTGQYSSSEYNKKIIKSAQSNLEEISRSAEKIGGVVRNIMEYNTGARASYQTFPVRDALSELVNQYNQIITNKSVHAICRNGSGKYIARADQKCVENAFKNLLEGVSSRLNGDRGKVIKIELGEEIRSSRTNGAILHNYIVVYADVKSKRLNKKTARDFYVPFAGTNVDKPNMHLPLAKKYAKDTNGWLESEAHKNGAVFRLYIPSATKQSQPSRQN